MLGLDEHMAITIPGHKSVIAFEDISYLRGSTGQLGGASKAI
jgi:hypothetical protein